MKRDTTKIMMTHKEIYKSNIGRMLNAFRERIKTKIRESSLCLAQFPGTAKHGTIAMTNHISYQNNIAFYEQTIDDIDCISKLLVEFANENNGWTIEDLGLPECEHNNEDSTNIDKGDKEEEGDSVDSMES